ncbi:MAG: Na+/H+ antiporter NhaA [Actinomycetales bacterium]|nr:Na+/H+ antiporter NhaA [Actinomycetales bacterium]
MFINLLIAIFFFQVGLEIRHGLKDFKSVIVPIVAALGGMIFPAFIFLVLNPNSHVWATAMPTDIALALGVLSLLGNRVHPQARIFLLTLAIADDLFSLMILGAFYGDDLNPEKALSTLGAAALGALLPLSKSHSNRAIKVLTPFSTYFIVPVIIAINIPLDIDLNSFTSTTMVALVIARSIGKILGITLFAWIAIKLGGKTQINLKAIAGIGALAGMGMTVSLVIAEIAAKNQAELDQVRLGLFVSAILSGIIGYVWLRRTPASR